MSKLFYDHLVLREELTADIDMHSMSPEEREELLEIIDQIFHHHVLNIILNHLPKEHHPEFVNRLKSAPHDQTILDFIKSKVTVDIEAEIKAQVAKVKKDIRSDIKKSKRH